MNSEELKILKNQLKKEREERERKILEKSKAEGFIQDPYQEAFDRCTARGYEIMENKK